MHNAYVLQYNLQKTKKYIKELNGRYTDGHSWCESLVEIFKMAFFVG